VPIDRDVDGMPSRRPIDTIVTSSLVRSSKALRTISAVSKARISGDVTIHEISSGSCATALRACSRPIAVSANFHHSGVDSFLIGFALTMTKEPKGTLNATKTSNKISSALLDYQTGSSTQRPIPYSVSRLRYENSCPARLTLD